MTHLATACLLLSLIPAAAPDQDAKTLAQDILTKGAALFDSRDAAAMAATYAENDEVHLLKKENDSDQYKVETYRGRADIQKGYADIFKDRSPSAKSKNVVEAAHFQNPGMLLIYGKFTLDTTSNNDSVSFIQIRVKQGDTWRILSLDLLAE